MFAQDTLYRRLIEEERAKHKETQGYVLHSKLGGWCFIQVQEINERNERVDNEEKKAKILAARCRSLGRNQKKKWRGHAGFVLQKNLVSRTKYL